MVPLAAALTLLLGAAVGPSSAGVRLVVEGLDVALTTPDGWRISRRSTPEELLLVTGAERGAVSLRVRRSAAVRTPRERMREIALELGEPYTGIEFEGEATREAGGRELVVVNASGGAGSEEVHVRLYVTRLGPGAEHLFWLEGAARGVRRAEDDVLACIAGATTAAAGLGRETPGAGGEPALRHRASGLVVERHPAGLTPAAVQPSELDGPGLSWLAEDEDAPLASLTLSRRSVAPMVDESSAAGSLGSELRRDPAVSELLSTRERVADLPARRLTWRREVDGGGALACEAWFFKSGTSLFRMDVVARPDWLGEHAESLADFRRGLRFEQ